MMNIRQSFFTSNRAVEKTYVSAEQEHMLQCCSDADYSPLLDAIEQIEQKTSLQLNASRLHRLDWQIDGEFLLAQLHPEVLKAVLANELPQRICGGDLSMEVRIPGDLQNAEFDPGIYINYIAGKSGKGVPIDDFPLFLLQLERAVGIPEVVKVPGASFTSKSLWQKLDFEYRKRRSQGTLNQRKLSEQLASGVTRLREQVRRFVDYNFHTVLPHAKAQGVSHIAIRGEVGLSKQTWKRCEQHKAISESSPALFRLVQMMLFCQYPNEGWALRQVIIFTIVRASQAEIGETIASILCAAYGSVGGVNFAQPGISANEIASMGATQWKDVANLSVAKGFLRHVKNNMERAIATTQDKIDNIRQQIEKDEMLREVARMQEELRKLDVPTRMAELHQSAARVESLLGRLQQAYREAEKDEEIFQRRVTSLLELKHALDEALKE